MLFNSVDFIIFFPIVILLYFVIPQKLRYLWLLAASYYFYMCWNAKYVLLLLFSTIVTYASGLLIDLVRNRYDGAKEVTLKKLVVAISLTLNLGILFYFKYFNFFISILNTIFNRLHISLNFSDVDILLPVGISFFTFQALSYTIDVYRGDIYAEKNFFRYALFVSFFPQLVAGPIERSKNLLVQLAKPTKFDLDGAREGILIMIWGFFLKIVLADRIAPFVDTIYSGYSSYTGIYLFVATILFAIQIYCDFYGYSVIAMGAAKVLGITLMENFNAPFLTESIGELWTHWHISLTSWFRDYLYIPLGGSRKGKARKFMNNMLVFLVSGLWHGAQFTYIFWGGINGLYQIIAELIKPARNKLNELLHINRDHFICHVLRIIGTFLLFNFSLVFFRASGVSTALKIIKDIFFNLGFMTLFDGTMFNCSVNKPNFIIIFICIAVLLFADICKKKGIKIRTKVMELPMVAHAIFVALAIVVVLLFGIWGNSYNEASFIYFQF